jgi:SiaC family regulatory phosphoprotein
MNDLIIPYTTKTPEIRFEVNGNLLIKGISIPENVNDFYPQVFLWMEEFGNNLTKNVTLTLEIDYMNTSSAKVILQLLRKAVTFASAATKLKLVWKYHEDEEDMKDLGEDLQAYIDYQFEFVKTR